MYIIGLQEVNSMINKRLKDAIFTDQWSELCMDTLGPFGYVLVTSQRMQGVLLLIFAKYYHLPFLRNVQTESTRTGLGGYWGNKGGVSARMAVFGHTVCFLNCHLPAHMENSEQRMEDFESILQQQQFDGQAAAVLDHDVVFWFGDLNFRIEDYEIQFVKNAIDGNKLSLLWDKDQLNMAKGSESVLEEFHEGPLKFPPTYKFDVGSNTYDTSMKKRKPAWTDRILWKTKLPSSSSPSLSKARKRSSATGLHSGLRVTQHCYRSHMEYLVSDHKPVSAIFTLQFPYKVDLPMITLIVDDEWNNLSDATAKFKMAANYPRSSWDWIGLYKVGFKHHKDYVGYVWAKQEESDYVKQEYQVTFGEESLPKGTGEYILGYYSNNMSSIVGVTEPFQISFPSSSPSSSPSDSSDFSSEDDSTVVLLRPKSRSPSPGKAKQRGRRSRSRSPALPRLQGLNLRPHSRETGARSPSPRTGAKRERLVCESDDSPDSCCPLPQDPDGSPRTPSIEVNAPEPLPSPGSARERGPSEGPASGWKASGERQDPPVRRCDEIPNPDTCLPPSLTAPPARSADSADSEPEEPPASADRGDLMQPDRREELWNRFHEGSESGICQGDELLVRWKKELFFPHHFVPPVCHILLFAPSFSTEQRRMSSPASSGRAAMKLNERSVVHYATCDSPPDKTGFLFKKGERNTAYIRRWFVLKGNMLFYFEDRDSKEPIGVIILEGCTVELCESSEEYAFAVKFDCAKSRVYKMAAESQAAMESWVKALSRASFDYMRLVVRELEKQLEEMRSLHRPQKRPAAHAKENGVSWNKPAEALNGYAACTVQGSRIPTYENVSEDGARPPPVPPRRKAASLESPVSPGTVCFSKLHDWYGKEIADLRTEWQQSQ
ncbi:PI5PA phosphatase, partial [Atractosteus spatula]|nr:PI5PA phosphatase [Atractosteus spatula]